MEIAALYEHEITQRLALSLYVAPVGDPAIGPVAFPHRSSAASDPLAPLGHHWEDATHITFGVLTLGMFSRTWKVEGSIFNGREPDEHRTNIEVRKLDSYSGRIFYNPNERWSYSVSTAYVASPEVLHPDESLHRYSASVMNTRLLGERGEWSTSLIYGANAVAHVDLSNSALVESDLSLDGVNTFFGRAEFVQKSAQDLVLGDQSDSTHYDIGAFTLGYSREIVRARAHARCVDPRHVERRAGHSRERVRHTIPEGLCGLPPPAPRSHAHREGDGRDEGNVGRRWTLCRRETPRPMAP